MNTYRAGKQTDNYHLVVAVVVLAGFWVFAMQFGAPSPLELLSRLTAAL